SQAFEQECIGGPIAIEHAVGHEGLGRFLRAYLGLGLAKGERLGLREEVGHQQVVVPSQWIEALREANEVTGNQLCTLMNQLVKSMLTIRPRLPPNDRASLVIHPSAIARHLFAIALHIELLQVRAETMEVLIVGENGLTLCPKEVVVPNADKAQ